MQLAYKDQFCPLWLFLEVYLEGKIYLNLVLIAEKLNWIVNWINLLNRTLQESFLLNKLFP